MARILVEKIFDPPITQERWNRDVEVGIPCHTAHNVHWIRSLMSRDRCRVICEFEAPDTETVRKSFRKAGLPFARIWTVEVIEPEGVVASSLTALEDLNSTCREGTALLPSD